MSTVPTLMFLYSNDATEIRYSDGSRLELSPCGSSMVYHPKARSLSLKEAKLQKRTRFVTSEHRDKVLQALDFRNRFATRPYLCRELLQEEDIIALYANIAEVAWPKVSDQAAVHILEDGSRRITSLDEYASLIVSPHCQDFTVCYLAHVSSEARKSKGSHRSQNSSTLESKLSSQLSMSYKNMDLSYNDRPREAVVHPYRSSDTASNICTSSRLDQFSSLKECSQSNPNRNENSCETNVLHHQQDTGQHRHIPNVPLHSHIPNNTGENSSQHNLIRKFSGLNSGGKINVSISQHKQDNNASFTQIVGSPSSHELSSISRSSTPDGLRTTIDTDVSHDMAIDTSLVFKHRHSSPTHRSSSPYHEDGDSFPPIFKQSLQDFSVDGSYFRYIGEEKKRTAETDISQHDNQNINSFRTILSNNSLSDHNTTLKGNNSFEVVKPEPLGEASPFSEPRIVLGSSEENLPSANNFKIQNTDSNYLVNPSVSVSETQTSAHCAHSSAVSGSVCCRGEQEVDEDRRSQYVWRTLHASRNNCPTEWIHPLRLALEGRAESESGVKSDSRPMTQHFQSTGKLSELDKKKCSVTKLPTSVPLTCPFQHEHRRELNDKTEGDQSEHSSSVGNFNHGKLNIIITEGIVYRLIHNGEMKVIEIHPGDGSILVSQGVNGHFFVHYILIDDTLEERTYSVKSLPPEQLKGNYSIGKFIKTAHRFFVMATQWDKRGLNEPIACWKKEVVAVVEPLSSSLLEECQVEGLGRFSAFSNGRVRIVFDDRVALDLQCDMSQCLNQTKETQLTTPMLGNQQSSSHSSGRLMLPSGDYVTVDLSNPGPYCRYVTAAKEWVSWVNASVHDRQDFYNKQHLPTVMKRAAELELKKIFCFNYMLDYMQNSESEALQTLDQRTQPHTLSIAQSSLLPHRAEPPVSQLSMDAHHGGNHIFSQNDEHLSRKQEFHGGIQSVRQALLQTSNLINDIDSFLESNKGV